MIGEIAGGIVKGLFEVGRAIEKDIKAGRVDEAKRRAREASDRVIGRAAARHIRQQRLKAKGK